MGTIYSYIYLSKQTQIHHSFTQNLFIRVIEYTILCLWTTSNRRTSHISLWHYTLAD